MIVNNTEQGWEIIYQRAHGLLAAEIGQHWNVNERPKRWIETIIAISDHDDDQQYWHGKHHLTSQGTPQDFEFQAPDLIQAKRVVEASKFKSGWIRLLISTHFHNLYKDLKFEDKKIDDFLSEQAQIRKKLLKELGIKNIALDEAYRLMYWCDRTSLILCKNKIPPDEKLLEIGEGPNGISYSLSQRKNGSIKITPWPFAIDSFEVIVETRLIKTMVFDNDDQLHQTLEKSTIKEKKWNFKKEQDA